MPKPIKRRIRRLLAALVLVVVLAGIAWFRLALRPMPSGPAFYVRFEQSRPLREVLDEMQTRGVVRNATALRLYAILEHRPQAVAVGTYQLKPGMSAGEILNRLARAVRQLVRLPETNWARRTASLLEKRQVANADEYMALFRDPAEFKSEVPFPLDGPTLEGFLYPDTYNLPPLLGARAVVERQLQDFDRRIWDGVYKANGGKPEDLYSTLIVASLVELEAGNDADRPMIAGVIQNRLKKGMPLQIDAAINYGLQRWRRLTFADYRDVDSPYNLYRHKGLPPTPICSPSYKSVVAAMRPAHHNYLYYVAMPDGRSLFSSTYAEHLKNVKKRREALEARGRS